MRSMRTVATLTVLAAALGVQPLTARAQSGGGEPTGKALYQQNCARCHGADGKGDGPVANSLQPRPSDFTDQAMMSKHDDRYLTKVIRKGGAATGLSAMMPPFQDVLSPAETKRVVAYIRELGKTGGKGK